MMRKTPKHNPAKHPTYSKKLTTLPKGEIQRKQEAIRWVLQRKTSLGEPLPSTVIRGRIKVH